MMTTGYDCQDLLNLVLMRPIFSPTNFVQIKGRGTRTHSFSYRDRQGHRHNIPKERFRIFDFFANYEYFEKEFDYDQVLPLPLPLTTTKTPTGYDSPPGADQPITIAEPDHLATYEETAIGAGGMKIDRKLFEKAKETIGADEEIGTAVAHEQWDQAVQIARSKYENQPELYLTLEKICKSEQLDRPIPWRELLERIFGHIARFKTRDEKLEDECDKFIAIHKPASRYVPHIKNYLKAYLTDSEFRDIIDNDGDMHSCSAFSFEEYKALNGFRDIVPAYVRDYIAMGNYAV